MKKFNYDEFIQPYKDSLMNSGLSRYFYYSYVIPKLVSLNRPITVVETGTMWETRLDHNMGAFTLVFGDLVKNWTGGKLITIDISQNHIDLCKSQTLEFAECIEYVTSDSVAYLENLSDEFVKAVDFFYFDSYDFFLPDPVPSQLHHFRELMAVYKRVSPTVFIAVDDNFLPHHWIMWNWMDSNGNVLSSERFESGNRILGKGTLIDCFLLQEGWKRMDDFLHVDSVHLLGYDKQFSKEHVRKILANFYDSKTTDKVKRSHFDVDVIKLGAVNGLGDSIILTSVTPNIKIENDLIYNLAIESHFFPSESVKFVQPSANNALPIEEISKYDWGGGHCTQRLQIATGQCPSLKPRGVLVRTSDPIKGRVFVHLSCDTDWKRKIPNFLSKDDQQVVVNFFSKNIQYSPFYFNNNLSVKDMIAIMEKCEFFLGIDSGPSHVAAALDVKSIIIINSPESDIYLPKLKECDVPNSEWLYPQNIHLNTSGESRLVPKFSEENLRSAFDGNIYPFWKEDFLDLAQFTSYDESQ